MGLNKKGFKVYFLFFLFCVGFAFGQETKKQDSLKIRQLKEVIVSATRTVRQLSSIPLPAQIVSKKEIQRINSQRLDEILTEQTGLVLVNDHGVGVQMQGMDSDYTLIMIDGVPLVGRTAGTFDLSRISVGNIKQLEIVKGASSSLYGSEAMAGVINIITENPIDGFGGNIKYRFSTFSTHDLNLSAHYKEDKFDISGFVNRYCTEGYTILPESSTQTVDPFYNYTISLKANYRFNENTSLQVYNRIYNEFADYIASESLQGEANTKEWNGRIKLDHHFNAKWRGYLDLYATRYQADNFLNNPDKSRYSESDYDQWMIRPEWRMTYQLSKKSNFVGGVGLTHETLDRTYFTNKPEFNAPYAYVQLDSRPLEKLNLILGARFDAHNAYKSQFSPKFAARYDFNTKIALKASAGYGYKAPAFRQLYLDFTNPTAGYTVIGYNRVAEVLPRLEAEGQIANITLPISAFSGDLNPESSLSFNVGFHLKPLPKLQLDVNVFRNNISDLIDTRAIARKTNGQNVFSYQNFNEVYTQGLEATASWKPNENITLSAGYQLLYAKDKDAENAFENGEVFARTDVSSPSFQLNKEDYFGLYNRSRHSANAKIFYSFPKWGIDANIRATYRSKYGIRDSNSNGYLDQYDTFVDGYSILDFAINKTFYKKYTLGLGIDNFTDFTDGQNISNIPGRILYVTCNIQF
ncbi:MAG: TonB-dependent receptor [Flavobacteriaceae bacterium]|nr:TonB-dependent receptor [Flavobacteriaceae bacterium]